MTTKSDFQSIRELLDDFKPQERGWISAEEADQIRTALELKQRSAIELQNIRDMTVLFLARRSEEQRDNTDQVVETMDIMSAVTHVIDMERFSRGMEV